MDKPTFTRAHQALVGAMKINKHRRQKAREYQEAMASYNKYSVINASRARIHDHAKSRRETVESLRFQRSGKTEIAQRLVAQNIASNLLFEITQIYIGYFTAHLYNWEENWSSEMDNMPGWCRSCSDFLWTAHDTVLTKFIAREDWDSCSGFVFDSAWNQMSVLEASGTTLHNLCEAQRALWQSHAQQFFATPLLGRPRDWVEEWDNPGRRIHLRLMELDETPSSVALEPNVISLETLRRRVQPLTSNGLDRSSWAAFQWAGMLAAKMTGPSRRIV